MSRLLRHILKNRTFSILNLLGLSVGAGNKQGMLSECKLLDRQRSNRGCS